MRKDLHQNQIKTDAAVIRNFCNSYTQFKNLHPGGWFTTPDGTYFIKTCPYSGERGIVNAVSVNTGEFFNFEDETKILAGKVDIYP